MRGFAHDGPLARALLNVAYLPELQRARIFLDARALPPVEQTAPR